MQSVLIRDVLDKLPVPELDHSLTSFLAPMLDLLPDRRLQRVLPLAVRGILAGQTPVVTAMAQSVARTECNPWPAAKRIYRLLDNPRVPPRLLTKGLYHLARATVAREQPDYLVVALDPVNFEKPYTHSLEGVSTVRKSTPPTLEGKARLTRGYPAITATVVNTRVPATTYANWFSYKVDFRSENWELKRALRMTRAVFPHHRLRFVGDSGLDDQKLFAWVDSRGGRVRDPRQAPGASRGGCQPTTAALGERGAGRPGADRAVRDEVGGGVHPCRQEATSDGEGGLAPSASSGDAAADLGGGGRRV